MIAIIDNGWSYSDHEIHFVRVPDERADEIAEALRVCLDGNWNSGSAYVVGIVREVSWRDPQAITDLADLFGDFGFSRWEQWKDEDNEHPKWRAATELINAIAGQK